MATGFRNLSKKTTLMVGSLAPLGIGFLCLIGSPPKTHSSQGDPIPGQRLLTIVNRTQSLTVENMKRTGRRVTLLLRNDSQRAVTAFSLSPGHYSVEPDLFPESSLKS